MRHQSIFISLLIGSSFILAACTQPASVGIPTPNQATRDALQPALTATVGQANSTNQATFTPLPPLATDTASPQQAPTPTTATQSQATTEPTVATPAEPTAEPTTEPTDTPVPSNTGTVTCGRIITYIVKPGDNLFRIALRYRTTINAIARRNGLSNTRAIRTGMRLRILTCARGVSDSVDPMNGSQPVNPFTG